MSVTSLDLPAGFLDQLAGAVDDKGLLVGDHVGADYASDESLHANAVRPAAVVLPRTTAEVAAVVTAAAAHGVPVTARGSGTGLSEACIPEAHGILVSFERMNRITQLDDAGHLAVVEPGATLAEVNLAARERGLVYPVFPGTDAGSIGGTIATNAGGMRAVKYGVTRHHVIGVEAVTGTGQVIRCGGSIVKNTSGYDLTQLIIGSEGTLALVTEATLRLSPLLAHGATILAPFTDVDTVAAVVPRAVVSGARPSVLEYIDRATMEALLEFNDLALGIPAAVAEKSEAYLLVELEGRTSDQLDQDVAELATLLDEAGAIDVFVLPRGQGATLIKARESAFWMVKAAGADDLIDMVVPRQLMPEYLRNVQAIAAELGSKVFGCGHAGDGNIHFSVFEPDADRRHDLMMGIYSMGMGLGGAISGEHGIGLGKKPFYQALEDPGKIALQRQVKAAFDPAGILNPGKIFDQA